MIFPIIYWADWILNNDKQTRQVGVVWLQLSANDFYVLTFVGPPGTKAKSSHLFSNQLFYWSIFCRRMHFLCLVIWIMMINNNQSFFKKSFAYMAGIYGTCWSYIFTVNSLSLKLNLQFFKWRAKARLSHTIRFTWLSNYNFLKQNSRRILLLYSPCFAHRKGLKTSRYCFPSINF